MGGNPFSKKVCQELLLFEDYLLSCKSTFFHKDQIIVDRERTLSLIAELRSYHCAEGRGALSEGETSEADLLELLEDTAEMAIRQPIKQTEVNISANDEGKAVLEAAQAEAERILTEAREKAKFVINEANIKADVLLKQAEEKAQEKQKQVDDLLVVKINDADKRSKELIERAHQNAELELESKTKQMRDMVLMSFQKADNLVEMAENIYAKQLEVIRGDRKEILDILAALSKQRKR